jgi:hypothetical protein
MLSLEYMNFVEQNEKKLNERDPRLGLPFAVYPWSSSFDDNRTANYEENYQIRNLAQTTRLMETKVACCLLSS